MKKYYIEFWHKHKLVDGKMFTNVEEAKDYIISNGEKYNYDVAVKVNCVGE